MRRRRVTSWAPVKTLRLLLLASGLLRTRRCGLNPGFCRGRSHRVSLYPHRIWLPAQWSKWSLDPWSSSVCSDDRHCEDLSASGWVSSEHIRWSLSRRRGADRARGGRGRPGLRDVRADWGRCARRVSCGCREGSCRTRCRVVAPAVLTRAPGVRVCTVRVRSRRQVTASHWPTAAAGRAQGTVVAPTMTSAPPVNMASSRRRLGLAIPDGYVAAFRRSP